MKSFLYLALLCLSVPALATLWSDPVLLPELNDTATGNNAMCPHLSSDGLTIYFSRKGADGIIRSWEAYRDTPNGPFTSERFISELYVGKRLYDPWVSADGLRMYYNQHESEATKDRIHMATRAAVDDPWQDTMTFTAIHEVYVYDGWCGLSSDELTMYYGRYGGAFSMWKATRTSITEQFTNPVLVPELNIGSNSFAPYLMPDGLTIYFTSMPQGSEYWNLYSATRSSLSDPFGNIEILNVSTGFDSEVYPYVTADSSVLYYSTPEGIWMSQAVPEPATLALVALGALYLRKK